MVGSRLPVFVRFRNAFFNICIYKKKEEWISNPGLRRRVPFSLLYSHLSFVCTLVMVVKKLKQMTKMTFTEMISL